MLSNEIGKFSWRKQKKQLVANFGKLQELTLSRCLVETHSNKVCCVLIVILWEIILLELVTEAALKGF